MIKVKIQKDKVQHFNLAKGSFWRESSTCTLLERPQHFRFSWSIRYLLGRNKHLVQFWKDNSFSFFQWCGCLPLVGCWMQKHSSNRHPCLTWKKNSHADTLWFKAGFIWREEGQWLPPNSRKGLPGRKDPSAGGACLYLLKPRFKGIPPKTKGKNLSSIAPGSKAKTYFLSPFLMINWSFKHHLLDSGPKMALGRLLYVVSWCVNFVPVSWERLALVKLRDSRENMSFIF